MQNCHTYFDHFTLVLKGVSIPTIFLKKWLFPELLRNFVPSTVNLWVLTRNLPLDHLMLGSRIEPRISEVGGKSVAKPWNSSPFPTKRQLVIVHSYYFFSKGRLICSWFTFTKHSLGLYAHLLNKVNSE